MDILANEFNTLITQYQSVYKELVESIESVDSSKNKTDIAKKTLYYSNQLKILNEKLSETNNKMIELNKSNLKDYEKSQQDKDNKFKILITNYDILEKERSHIQDMMNEYNTLDSAYVDGNIYATSSYYKYISYLLVAILLILLFFRFSLGGGQFGGSDRKKTIPWFMFVFLSIVIVFNAIIKK